MSATEFHCHLIATKTRKDGNKDVHRYVVATEFVEAEQKVALELGYGLQTESCTDPLCLGASLRRS